MVEGLRLNLGWGYQDFEYKELRLGVGAPDISSTAQRTSTPPHTLNLGAHYETPELAFGRLRKSRRASEAPHAAAGQAATVRPYVIDIGVRELAAATRVWSELLGRDATPMHPEMDVSGALAGCHFATGGVYSLGLMALRDPSRRIPAPHEDPNAIGAWLLQRQLETRGEGIACIGFQSAPGVAETMRRLGACGVRFLHERPQRYLVGENCYVDPATTNDCAVIFAQHDAAAYARWQASLPEALRALSPLLTPPQKRAESRSRACAAA